MYTNLENAYGGEAVQTTPPKAQMPKYSPLPAPFHPIQPHVNKWRTVMPYEQTQEKKNKRPSECNTVGLARYQWGSLAPPYKQVGIGI